MSATALSIDAPTKPPPVRPLPPPFTPPAPVPAERELSLLRLLGAFRRDVLSTWTRAAYEEDVLVRPFLNRRSVLVNSPAAIREVLMEGGERFGRTPATLRLLRPLIGNGLFLSEGAAWRHQRRTLAPAFTPRAVGAVVPHMRSATAEALDRLGAAAGRPLDLLNFTQTLALEIAGRTMFSLGLRRHGGTLRNLLGRYGRGGGPSALDLLLPESVTTPRDVRRRRFGRDWMAMVERLIAERTRAPLPEGAGARDMLDMLLAARDSEGGAPFAASDVRDQAATMILAGHETTALTLFWCLALLAQSAPWQDALAAEADAAGAAPDPDSLELARAVVNEALRLYPPAFAVVRMAREPTEVAGVSLRPGDAVMVAPWVLHRHRRLWDAPGRFDPRRFLAPAPAPDRFSFLPFGAGPRVCIGAHFAITEAVLALSAIVGQFRVALAGPRPVLPVAVVTTVPDHAPLFRVERR